MKCNRSCCRVNLEDGKTYYNRSTQAYYCQRCASLLNKANYKEALALYNGPLCVLVPSAKEHFHGQESVW